VRLHNIKQSISTYTFYFQRKNVGGIYLDNPMRHVVILCYIKNIHFLKYLSNISFMIFRNESKNSRFEQSSQLCTAVISCINLF